MDNSNSNENESRLTRRATEDLLTWAYATLGTKDDAARILRLHALTEHYLDRLLTLRLKHPRKVVEDGRFTYYHKKAVVAACGALPEHLVDALSRLSKLRNKCAHSFYPEITTHDITWVAEPVKTEFDQVQLEKNEEGVAMDGTAALCWAIFSELSLRVAPLEEVFSDLLIPNE